MAFMKDTGLDDIYDIFLIFFRNKQSSQDLKCMSRKTRNNNLIIKKIRLNKNIKIFISKYLHFYLTILFNFIIFESLKAIFSKRISLSLTNIPFQPSTLL